MVEPGPSVEFLSRTYPEFHFVFGASTKGGEPTPNTDDAMMKKKTKKTKKTKKKISRARTFGTERVSYSLSSTPQGLARSPPATSRVLSSMTGPARFGSGKDTSKNLQRLKKRLMAIEEQDNDHSSSYNLLPPPPEETRIRPMDPSLRSLGYERIVEYYGDKRNFSKNNVGPHYKTKTNGLKRRLRKARRSNRRFTRRYAKMKSAADSLNKFNIVKKTRPTKSEIESTTLSQSSCFADVPNNADYSFAESLEQHSSTEEHEIQGVTNEEIRQATTRLSRAREQLSRFNQQRMSTAANHMHNRIGYALPDQSSGMYDLPARPMTSSIRRRMIGCATRVDLNWDDLDAPGPEGISSTNRKAWMGLSPECDEAS